MVRVKSNFDGDIRRFPLQDSPTFNALREQIRTIYTTNDFTIKYKDEDDDFVTITSDDELREAVSEMDDKGVLRIYISKNDSSQPVEVSTSSEPSEPREVVSVPSPSVESSERVADASPTTEPVEAAVDDQTNAEHNDESATGNSADGRSADAPQPSNRNSEPTLEEVLASMVRMATQMLGCERMNNEAGRQEHETRGSTVPRPTLGFGSVGNEVRQLQKVLTDLGYMTPADYRIRAGLYGPRTANGVVRFRMECGLGYGMYDEAAATALRSLVESGVPATMASGGGTENTETSSQSEERTEA